MTPPDPQRLSAPLPRDTTQLHAIATAQQGFLTLGQAAESGLSESAVRHLVERGDWYAVGRGLRRVSGFADDDPWRDRVRCALLLAGPGALAAGHTAARLHGLVGAPALAPCWLVVPPQRHPQRRPGVRVTRTVVATDDVTAVAGIPATSVGRTLLDVARHGDRLSAVCLLESAVRGGWADLEKFRATVQGIAGQRGSLRATTALHGVDMRSESPLETRARLLLLAAGLPYPELQYPVAPGDCRRIDLAYKAPAGSAYTGLAIEIDGREVHARAEAFDRDPRRQTALEEALWLVRRFTARHLDDPAYVIQTVRRALARIGNPTN